MAKKEIYLSWGVAFLSSILLSIPYLVPHGGLVMLFAFVPLLYLDYMLEMRGRATKKGGGAFKYYFTTFLLWNLFTTYWIYNATIPGAVAAIFANALQMSLIFAAFRWFKKRTRAGLAYLFFILCWMAWEHFYFEAEISWPWLVVGNGFATSYKLVQWYEFTGVLGGTFWALLCNVAIFSLLVNKMGRRSNIWRYALILLLFVAPVVTSLIIYNGYEEEGGSAEFVVLQPNIDPYNDKYGSLTQLQQDSILLSLAQNVVTKETSVVIAPETFTSGIVENYPESDASLNRLKEFIAAYPSSSFLFGATTIVMYDTQEAPTYTARRRGAGGWYDVANSAMFLNELGELSIYHKSKLVVMVEHLPYPKYLPFLSKLSVNLGGISGSCLAQKEREVFLASDGDVRIGSAICYESVYGDFYREYVLKGANVMSIITNDGWWGNTPGYMQHFRYASLRAIETRRSIARSANTGISAFINQRGDVIEHTDWWVPATLRGRLVLNEKITTFVKYGDFPGRVAYYSMILFLALAVLIRLKIYGKAKL